MSSDLGSKVVIVNFKAYAEVDGPKASALAKACQDVAAETGASIVACPPIVELSAVAASVKIPVLSQNIDPKKPGSATGWVTPSMVKACGCAGTLINHAEHKMPIESIAEAIRMAHELGLVTVVCAESVEKAKEIAAYAPEYIAVEPPELIGGDISVTTADPAIVRNTVDAVKSVDSSIRVLCGAGVKNGRDVTAAISLGAEGVLLASGVVKATDPHAVLRDLVSGL
ncbi:MAG: triose-phosphate isomerase [archaeon]|nr:triose-phosphate isomerase [archaeon]